MPPLFADEAAAILNDLVSLRRRLHQQPELGNVLPLTQAAVLQALDGLPLEITRGKELSSVVAVLRGGRPGPTVLLRGDMDGLPVEEQTGLEFASTNGAMHACGHDLHTAGLVGAARLLSAHREELPGTVIFMFQPGEEGPGGAKPMIDEGLLDVAGERPVAAYGIHVSPGPRGTFVYRPGAALAGSNILTVTLDGVGGHASRPEDAANPVAALLELGAAIPAMTARRFSVFDPVVATVTQLTAGSAVNIIPPRAQLRASVRTLSADSTSRFGEEARTLAEGIAAAHGVRAEVDWFNQYPVTVNDARESAFAAGVLSETFGAGRIVEAPDPLMGSEDMSYVLQEVPGCFFFLQASPEGVDGAEWNHSPKVLFDDTILADQAAALAQIAFERLSRG